MVGRKVGRFRYIKAFLMFLNTLMFHKKSEA